MTELIDSIPETAREVLEIYLKEDILGAVVTETVPVVDCDGKIFFSEIILCLEDGRDVAIVPEMQGMCPWLTLMIRDGYDWRKMTVEDDYVDELVEMAVDDD